MRTRRLEPDRSTSTSPDKGTPNVVGESYTVKLPDDYYHILNCICEFQPNNSYNKCGNTESSFHIGANKLDTSQWSSVITNYYMRPSVKRPYYYISNVLTNDTDYE